VARRQGGRAGEEARRDHRGRWQHAARQLNTDRVIDYRDKDKPGRPYNNLLVTAFNLFGFREEDYKKFPNQNGFGAYEAAAVNYAPYADFVTNAGRNAPLPGLLAG
jgi:hypothetical protein